MRPSERKRRRERNNMLKAGAGVLGATAAVAGGILAVSKSKKSSKTEDKLDDVKNA